MSDSLVVRSYQKIEMDYNGQSIYALKFTEGEFSDIIFSYHRVQFIEDEKQDRLITKFEYIIHEGSTGDSNAEFEKELGDFLIELIIQGIYDNDIVYTGGTKEE